MRQCTLKANQGTLYQDVVDLFTDARTTGFAELEHDSHQTVDKGRGRLDHRQYWTISDAGCIAYFNVTERWPGLRSIGMVEAERKVGEQLSTVHCLTKIFLCRSPFIFLFLASSDAATRIQGCR